MLAISVIVAIVLFGSADAMLSAGPLVLLVVIIHNLLGMALPGAVFSVWDNVSGALFATWCRARDRRAA